MIDVENKTTEDNLKSIYIINAMYGDKIYGEGDFKILVLKTIRKTYYRSKSKSKRKFIDSYIMTKNIGKNHYKVIEGIGPYLVALEDLRKEDYVVIPLVKDIVDLNEIKLSDYNKNYFLKGDKIKCNNRNYSVGMYNKIMEEYYSNPIKGKKAEISKKYKISNATISNWTNQKQKPRTDIHIFNNKIIVDNNFMRLLGYYLAEGAGVSDHQIRFTFNKAEKEYIEDVKFLLKKVFGIDHNKDVPNNNALNVAASSRLLKEFFRNIVGNEANIKTLPEWILYLPHHKQKELINGYWRGDGSKSEYGFNFSTSSLVLAKQIQMILRRLGFVPLFYTNKIKRKNVKYVVEVYGEKLKDFCDIVGKHHEIIDKRTKTYNNGWNDGNYIFLPIRGIFKIQKDSLFVDGKNSSLLWPR